MVAGQWLTVQDVAELLQVRIETVRRWVRRGELPVLELGGARSVYRIRPDDLDRFVWQRYRSLGMAVTDDPLPAISDGDDAGNVGARGTRSRAGEGALAAHNIRHDPSGIGVDEHLQIRVDSIPAVTFRMDANRPGVLLFISREIEALLGYPVSQWRERSGSWLENVLPDDRERVETEYARTAASGDPFSMDYRMIAADGRVVWIHSEAVLTSDTAGGAPVWEGMLVDVSERKRIEESLGLRGRQQRAVAEFGQHALAGMGLSALLEEAVTYVSRSLDVEFCKVFEVLPGGDSLVLRAGVGWREGHIGEIAVPSGDAGLSTVSAHVDSQAGYTLISNDAVIAEDLASEERFDGARMATEYGAGSGASVIIPGRGRPFGVLGAHSTRQRSFNREDIFFLQSVANVLASVVARTDLNWLTVTEVAGSLQVTEETVRRWIRRSELPALNLGGPRAGYRVFPSDLERFISDRLSGG